jgi:hypothetical protein
MPGQLVAYREKKKDCPCHAKAVQESDSHTDVRKSNSDVFGSRIERPRVPHPTARLQPIFSQIGRPTASTPLSQTWIRIWTQDKLKWWRILERLTDFELTLLKILSFHDQSEKGMCEVSLLTQMAGSWGYFLDGEQTAAGGQQHAWRREGFGGSVHNWHRHARRSNRFRLVRRTGLRSVRKPCRDAWSRGFRYHACHTIFQCRAQALQRLWTERCVISVRYYRVIAFPRMLVSWFFFWNVYPGERISIWIFICFKLVNLHVHARINLRM